MKIRNSACFLVAVCILLCSAGCSKQTKNPTNSKTDKTSNDIITNVSFSDMPVMDTPLVRTYPGNGTLLFEYITPGMDSYQSTIVNYSLTEDKMLGQVDLGEGRFSIETDSKGGFSVFDACSAEGKFYSSDCRARKTVNISCVDGDMDFIAQGKEDEKMLVSAMSSGNLYLITPDGKNKTRVDLQPGIYEMIGRADGRFVVSRDAQTVFVVEQDSTAREIFSKGDVQLVNSDYAAGRIVDHLAFLPLQQGDWMFSKVNETDEVLISAGKGGFLTSTAKEQASVLRLYRMAKMKFAEAEIIGLVEAAAVTSDGQVAVVIRGSQGFTYKLVDTSVWQEKPFSLENDLSAVIGSVSLPAIGEKDETDAYTKEILHKYNLRFMYEPCELLDEMAEIGLHADLHTDRKRILTVEKQLVKSFAFLPDEVWKNIGGGLPFVVLLCDAVPGNVEGLSFEYGGYNCIFVEIGGRDSFYTDIFIHEVGHAISHCVYKAHPELIEEWLDLTPKEVLKAVEKGTVDGKNALTTEFTPDDKSGKICYVSAYALKNPEEDRAETLAKFYDTVFVENDTKLFSNEVLRKKALHWEKMIRETFSLEKGTVLPFDTI